MNQISHSSFSAELFDRLPVGILAISTDLQVKHTNATANQLLQLSGTEDFINKIHPDSVETFKQLMQSELDTTSDIQLLQGANSLYTRFKLLARNNESSIFTIEDITEIIALGRQLKAGKQPQRKFVHDVSNALTTTIGYTELINMMLQEHEALTGDKLEAVRRYQKEVLSGLQRADAIIKNKKQGAAEQFSPAIPLKRKHVVVVDDEPQITDFLCELLKARQYKVTAFTDGVSALDYYRDNGQSVDLVIMDQVMPEMSGISLATELLALDINQPIVLCTGDQMMIQEQDSGNLKIKHFLSKPIDINELTEMVSDIIDEEND